MKIHENVAQWMAASKISDVQGRGLVPTMGALHEGHGSLIRRCVLENTQSVVTIYVNPTQFENPDDLTNYPDSLQEDIRYLESLGVTDLVLPQYKELYPFDFTIFVDESLDSRVLCGKNRAGHFKGVLVSGHEAHQSDTGKTCLLWQEGLPAVSSCQQDGRSLLHADEHCRA